MYEIFDKLSQRGYHSAEIRWIPTPLKMSGHEEGGKDFGVKVCVASASPEPMHPGMSGEFLVSDFDKIVGDCKTLDCNYLRVGMLPFTCMGSRDKALDFVRRMDEMAERLQEYGISLY